MSNAHPTSPCVLVLLDPARDMPQGTEQSLQLPYISLGRDTDCTICFGDDFPMVSRLHAAIEWSEEGYSLRHLSNTNQTLLNGRPIGRKWFLHDDDIIQLAPTGPKIKFKVPLILNIRPGRKKKPAAAKSGLSARLNVENVALVAVVVLAVLLTILMVSLTLFGD
ncbi:FHA domain-containing protein [Cesiribacter andamanensis]|uniref:FHA domain-containing protein n=1 Tax=Cesiribacter andamanensis TaxID=649507 RepID=UPI001377A17A|nr:FHA domain-containing protein [Cesiribacter andamanensis]